jgi:hypothetical protein
LMNGVAGQKMHWIRWFAGRGDGGGKCMACAQGGILLIMKNHG